MSYFAYSLLTYLLLPFGLLKLLWRSRISPAYRLRWRERLGFYGADREQINAKSVVFHAVSVGEVHAAQPLIDLFMRAYPDVAVVLTTATPTGSARVSSLFSSRVEHVYLPWDLPGACERFLLRFNPSVCVLLETELWPNLLKACSKHHCSVVLANARLSEKSMRGYRRFGSFSQEMLSYISIIAAQSDADAQRFISLGVAQENVCINGSLKFDVIIDQSKVEQARAIKQQLLERPIWIGASTREGEDAKLLQAFAHVRSKIPDALLVLVPRHPERFAEAGNQALSAGFQVQKFSCFESLLPTTQVLIGDTMGDMVLYYSLADVAFVGGSLVPTGCQNIIEPAALGLPVITGPSLYNFQKVSELLLSSGGMKVVQNPTELAETIVALLLNQEERVRIGQLALLEVQRNQGAAQRLLKILGPLL